LFSKDLIGVGGNYLERIKFMKNRNWAEMGCFHAAALRRKKKRRRAQFCHVNHVGKAGRQPSAACSHIIARHTTHCHVPRSIITSRAS